MCSIASDYEPKSTCFTHCGSFRALVQAYSPSPQRCFAKQLLEGKYFTVRSGRLNPLFPVDFPANWPVPGVPATMKPLSQAFANGIKRLYSSNKNPNWALENALYQPPKVVAKDLPPSGFGGQRIHEASRARNSSKNPG